MSNVFQITDAKATTLPRTGEAPLKSGDGGGTFDGMEPRVKALEDGMTDIKVTLARIEERMSHLATKEDVGKMAERVAGLEKSSLTYWQFLGTGIALSGLLLAAMVFLMRPDVQAFIRGVPASAGQ